MVIFQMKLNKNTSDFKYRSLTIIPFKSAFSLGKQRIYETNNVFYSNRLSYKSEANILYVKLRF